MKLSLLIILLVAVTGCVSQRNTNLAAVGKISNANVVELPVPIAVSDDMSPRFEGWSSYNGTELDVIDGVLYLSIDKSRRVKYKPVSTTRNRRLIQLIDRPQSYFFQQF